MIVQPTLRREWLAERDGGEWVTLDFGDDDAAGVEVVEYLEPVVRKVDLTSGFTRDKLICSS